MSPNVPRASDVACAVPQGYGLARTCKASAVPEGNVAQPEPTLVGVADRTVLGDVHAAIKKNEAMDGDRQINPQKNNRYQFS